METDCEELSTRSFHHFLLYDLISVTIMNMKKICALFVCIAMVFGVFGCSADSGADQAESSAEVSETESDETSAVDTETVETEEITETTEETVTLPVVELTGDEYYADYPLVAEKHNVFVRCIPGFDFYPDGVYEVLDQTWYEFYVDEGMDDLMLFTSADTADKSDLANAYIEVALNADYDLDWFVENAETGYFGDGTTYFEIGEPEVCDNGITICEIKQTFINEYVDIVDTFYVIEYQIDETDSITIRMFGFVQQTWIDKDPDIINYADENPGPTGFEDYLQPVLDFYRTEEEPFLVLDKDVNVIVS